MELKIPTLIYIRNKGTQIKKSEKEAATLK